MGEERVKSLYEQLYDYGNGDYYPYHMPGHKRREMGGLPSDILKIDITEIDGFDNLHQPEGVILQLQEAASVVYSAEESFYLVNGSTGGILSAISAALSRGGRLLMARNCHKSAYHAAYLRGLQISTLYPEWIEEYGIWEAVTKEQVQKALDEDPSIGAVFIVTPTYEGRIADVAEIAKVVHEKGIPLIVDEAHGAHFGLAENFPMNSNQAGADLVIHSVHKTLPAMTQTALLHVNGNRINRERLRRFLHIYQTSSPSYVLMASIDSALRIIEDQGKEKFAFFRESYLQLCQKLSQCMNLTFLPWDPKHQDIGKLVIGSGKTGLSGQEIFNLLREKYHLQLEMAGENYCLAMFTVADTKEAYDRMGNALLELDKVLGEKKNNRKKSFHCEEIFMRGNSAYTLEEAWDMPWEWTPLEGAVDRRTAEFINLYPPGTPLLIPGEKLSKESCKAILSFWQEGLEVQGVYSTKDGLCLKCICG